VLTWLTVTGPNDFSSRIISEFRANGGKAGGVFAGSSRPADPARFAQR
jgi:hypothetical protein